VSILVVDDEPDLLELYELTLVREGFAVETAGSVAEAWKRLEATRYELMITDMRLPDGSGLDLIRGLEAQGRRERVLVITAFGSAENAVDALKAGAFDYLAKPVDLRRFRQLVTAALNRPLSGAAGRGRDWTPGGQVTQVMNVAGPGAIHRLVGSSAVMQQVRETIARVARTMAPVLVRGESGTGKELVARATHEASDRARGPFVPVNCGAIAESLIEAELFGHRRGAFTGADDDRPGLFQAAAGGTLFLDEIGDLPHPMQAKLLRAVQERAIRPVGSAQEVPTDVRIVAATHHDLTQMVAERRFRQDLFYRLSVIEVWIPPLRERRADIPDIAAAILMRLRRETGMPAASLDESAIDALRNMALPGNVRELENLLTRAVAWSGGGVLSAGSLNVGLPSPPAARLSEGGPGTVTAMPPYPSTQQVPTAEGGARLQAAVPRDLQEHLDEEERRVLMTVLAQHRFNRTATAAALGMSLRQIRYRLARLGIDVAEHKRRLASPPDRR
jgi:two-component system response regulator PilR (NtrC family)